jgi:hypothetical protein
MQKNVPKKREGKYVQKKYAGMSVQKSTCRKECTAKNVQENVEERQ